MLASSTGNAGATRSNSALPSSSAGPPWSSRSPKAASCALSWPVIDAIRCAQVAIESAVCTWELSTGGDWSISWVIGSTVLPASIASDGRSVDDARQLRPQPGDGLVRLVDDGAQVVLRNRLQRGVGGVEQASDVGRDLDAHRLGDDIAVSQRARWYRRRLGRQFDELLADGRAAVHRRRDIGRDLDRPSRASARPAHRRG